MLLSVYGDSIAVAYGLPPQQGFVPKLARRMANSNHRYTNYANFGQDGMTSWDLASAFADHADWRDGLASAAAICILIGGDDLIRDLPILLQTPSKGAAHKAMLVSQKAYLTLLASAVALKNRRACIAVGTVYNPFPHTPIAAEAVNIYNDSVIATAARQFSVPIAPIHQAFSGNEPPLIRGYSNGVAGAPGRNGIRYPIHPSAEGQSVIANVFATTLAASPPTPKQ